MITQEVRPCGCWRMVETNAVGVVEELRLTVCDACMQRAWEYLDRLWIDSQAQLTLPLPSTCEGADGVSYET